jgi:zinc transport system substrate-binding protein
VPPSLRALILCTLLLGPLGALSVAAAESAASPRIRISASVPPLAGLARQIGGDRVDAEALIPPGAAPDSYALRPQQAARIDRAELHLLVGHPAFAFEQAHLLPLLRSKPPRSILDIAALTGAQGGEDPHVWLAPSKVIPFVEALAERLSDLDPANASGYRQRLGRFLEDTQALDARIRSLTSTLGEDRSFLVQHPAWGWFAGDYELVQIAIEQDGKEPGPRTLIPLIESARARGTRTVFVQPGFPRRHAELVAREIGADVEVLDPIAEDWSAGLLFATERIVAARAGAPTP